MFIFMAVSSAVLVVVGEMPGQHHAPVCASPATGRPSLSCWRRLAERARVQNCLPVCHAGECVGGIGVSGINDEPVAQASADALEQRSRKRK